MRCAMGRNLIKQVRRSSEKAEFLIWGRSLVLRIEVSEMSFTGGDSDDPFVLKSAAGDTGREMKAQCSL